MNGYEVIGIVLLLVGAAGAGFMFGHMAGVYDAQRQHLLAVAKDWDPDRHPTDDDIQYDPYPSSQTKP